MGIHQIKMKFAATLFALAQANLVEEFSQWKLNNGKAYNAELNERKFATWLMNRDFVVAHNTRYLSGEETFTVEMNKFADLNESEFANQVLMQPTEGAHFKATGTLVSLSEQNLVDCSKAEGNMGCHGGLMDQGFTYIIKNGGTDTEDSYKYTAKDGTCTFNADNVGATISTCFDVPQQSEADLETAVASIGPISVAIDAHLRSFQLYKQGISHDKHCSSTRLDHGVLAVGYNNDDSGKYWIVKNSWGETWGDQGYIHMIKDKKNACGIATVASYPVV